MMDVLFDAIGIIGVMIVLLAYLLLQTQRISPRQIAYPVMNITGSALLLVSLMWTWNTPSIIIQIAWIAISIYGIVSIIKEQNNAEK